MQIHFEELEKQIDFLMAAAIQKCGNIPEAEELTQETLLGALTALSQGRKIENLQGWLITVMNRRFYDSLRKKYRKPFISIGSDRPLYPGVPSPADCLRFRSKFCLLLCEETGCRHGDGYGLLDFADSIPAPRRCFGKIPAYGTLR